jgi:putative transposase
VFVRQYVLDLSEKEYPQAVSDRGSTMKSKLLAQTLEPLHILRCFMRPNTPTDNPFIESFFSTLKGHPTYPGRFENFDHTRAYYLSFFPWYYNDRHLHSSIGYVTLAAQHYNIMRELPRSLSRGTKALQARQHRLKQNRLRSSNLNLDT